MSVSNNFVEWYETTYLQLNFAKTIELLLDLRKQKTTTDPINIMVTKVEIVENYNNLGVHIDSKQD